MAYYLHIETLERFPERCPRAREALYLDEGLRQLVFKSHRIVFSVHKREKRVYVFYVRHSKRRAIGKLGEDDIDV